jgi:hypothetical protein
MLMRNVHTRELPATAEAVGGLLDALASPKDRLWPRQRWPAIRFDRPLQQGATGGHCPIGYSVHSY